MCLPELVSIVRDALLGKAHKEESGCLACRAVVQGMSIAAGPHFDTPRQKRTDCGNVVRTVLSKEVAVSDRWPCSEPLWRWRLSVPATSPSAGRRRLRLTSRRDDRRHGDRSRTLSATALQPGIAPSRTRSAGENSSQAADRAGSALHRPPLDAGQNPGRRAAQRRAARANMDAADRNRSTLWAPSRRWRRHTSRQRGSRPRVPPPGHAR
jgi:hypothetical protein